MGSGPACLPWVYSATSTTCCIRGALMQRPWLLIFLPGSAQELRAHDPAQPLKPRRSEMRPKCPAAMAVCKLVWPSDAWKESPSLRVVLERAGGHPDGGYRQHQEPFPHLLAAELTRPVHWHICSFLEDGLGAESRRLLGANLLEPLSELHGKGEHLDWDLPTCLGCPITFGSQVPETQLEISAFE